MSINETMRNDEISEDVRNENDNKGTENRAYCYLYESAAKGEWGKAEGIFKSNPQYVGDGHSDVRDTALRAALKAEQSDFVQKLLRSSYMKIEDLKRKNGDGNTAFILAVMLGNIEVVLMMLEKNKDLVNIRNRGGKLPVQMAASLGHEKMVNCLYIPTRAHFNDDDRIRLLLTLIENDIYDVALSMVEEFPWLAVFRKADGKGEKKDGNGEKTDGNGKAEANVEKKDGNGEKTDGNGKADAKVEKTDGNGEKKDGNGKADANVEKTDINGEKKDENAQKTDGNVETALHALARKPLMTLNEFGNSKQGILKGFCCPFRSSIMVKKKMNPEARKLLELLWKKIVNQLDYNQISDLITTQSTLISDAAKEGNIEFISILIRNQPNVILNVDENKYTLFHTAVEYRQEKIFKLIYEKPSIKNVVVKLKVAKEEKNNILHLAAKLPPDQNRLKVVSGAALQMQRELRWFKEVSKLMPPSIAEAKNGQGKTARTLFTESHKDLRKEGEEWMKTTANSCMIVATLIATIVFAAAFTVPGGVKDDTGDPHFLRKASFICFAIFDIISLVSSSCSILIFLSILTARYAEEDFLRSLPRKLLLGLFTLCISIVAMMAVFCTTLYIVFDEGTKVPALLAIALASILVLLFILLQIRLFLDVFFSLMFSSA